MQTSPKTVQAVTLGLIVVVVAGLVGVVILAATSHPVPDVLGNITTTALGALAALLVSTRTGAEPPPPPPPPQPPHPFEPLPPPLHGILDDPGGITTAGK